MTSWNPHKLTTKIAGLTIIALITQFSCACLSEVDADPAHEKAEVIQLRTDGFPVPWVILGDPQKRYVTALEIQGEIPIDSDGKGQVTLDESILTFNEFGDAAKPKHKSGEPYQVIFRLLHSTEKSEKRRTYELEFADGLFANRFYLYYRTNATDPIVCFSTVT
jgi:hypothetical protein